jgi:hypothetical protein
MAHSSCRARKEARRDKRERIMDVGITFPAFLASLKPVLRVMSLLGKDNRKTYKNG